MEAWRPDFLSGGAGWPGSDVEILLDKYLNAQCFVLKYIILCCSLMGCCL